MSYFLPRQEFGVLVGGTLKSTRAPRQRLILQEQKRQQSKHEEEVYKVYFLPYRNEREIHLSRMLLSPDQGAIETTS